MGRLSGADWSTGERGVVFAAHGGDVRALVCCIVAVIAPIAYFPFRHRAD